MFNGLTKWDNDFEWVGFKVGLTDGFIVNLTEFSVSCPQRTRTQKLKERKMPFKRFGKCHLLWCYVDRSGMHHSEV